MKRIAIFCGSSDGNSPVFRETAYNLGKILAQKGIDIVYGGAKVGIMKAVADGAMQNNGSAIGVLTRFLQGKEVAHNGLTELILVDSMHERKHKMNELSNGMIALPGGFGTLDELFDVLTLGQLGQHQKPIGILNINGYFDHLVSLLQTMTEKGFLKEQNRSMLLIADSVEALLEKMYAYQPSTTSKWIQSSS